MFLHMYMTMMSAVFTDDACVLCFLQTVSLRSSPPSPPHTLKHVIFLPKTSQSQVVVLKREVLLQKHVYMVRIVLV